MKWKTLAIIFFVIMVLETAVYGYMVLYSFDVVEKQLFCIENVCDKVESNSYYYKQGLCQCHQNGELVKEEWID